jgi:hypothetical protein
VQEDVTIQGRTNVQGGVQTPAPDQQFRGQADVNVQGGAMSGQDNQWRYRWHSGRWWYWTPSNNWVVWVDNNWQPYAPGMFGTTSTYSGSYGYSSPNSYSYPSYGYRTYNYGYQPGVNAWYGSPRYYSGYRGWDGGWGNRGWDGYGGYRGWGGYGNYGRGGGFSVGRGGVGFGFRF